MELMLENAPAFGIVLLACSMALNFAYKRLWWQVLVGVVIHGCAMIWWIGDGEPGAVLLFGLIYFVVFACFGVPLAVYAIRLPRIIWSLNAGASNANKQE